MRRQDKVGEFRVGYDPIPEWMMDYVRRGRVRTFPPGPISTQAIEVNGKAIFHRGAILRRRIFNRYIKGHPAYPPMCNQ